MDQAERIAEINERKGRAPPRPTRVSFVAGMTMLGMVVDAIEGDRQGQGPAPDHARSVVRRVRAGRRRSACSATLIGSFKNDRVSGFAEWLAGPMAQFASDTAGRSRAAFKVDKETGERGRKLGYKVARLARRYTPGTTIWYARARSTAAVGRAAGTDRPRLCRPSAAADRDGEQAGAGLLLRAGRHVAAPRTAAWRSAAIGYTISVG
jgi:hypothetical protein